MELKKVAERDKKQRQEHKQMAKDDFSFTRNKITTKGKGTEQSPDKRRRSNSARRIMKSHGRSESAHDDRVNDNETLQDKLTQAKFDNMKCRQDVYLDALNQVLSLLSLTQ